MQLCSISKTGDTVQYAVDVLPKQVNPHASLDYVESIISAALTSRLYEYDDIRKTYVEKNIEKTIISEDKLTCTFYLSQDMFWNDGTKVKAIDFVNGFLYTMELGEYSPICNIIDAVKNWDEVFYGELSSDFLGIKALDDYVLRIELDYPMPYLPELLSKIYASPRKIDKNSKKQLYSGPYYLASCASEEIVLEKNKYFFKNKIEHEIPKKVVFKLFTNMYDVLKLYKRGEVGITCNTQFPYELIEQSSKYEDFHVIQNSGLNYVLHVKDVELKRKISSIIQRKAICEKLYNGIVPLYNFLGSEVKEGQNKISYKALSAEKEIQLIYTDYYPNLIVVQEIKKQLEEKAGIKIKLVEKSLDKLIQHIVKQDYEIALDICNFSVYHPIAICFSLINNLSESGAEMVIELVENYYNKAELNINKLERILNEELTMVPLFKIKSLQFVNPSIEGYQVKADGSVIFA